MKEQDAAVIRIWLRDNENDEIFLGTASLISLRHLLTCKHVLKDPTTQASFPPHELYIQGLRAGGGLEKVGQTHFHPERDIALLILPEAAPDPDINPIPLSETKLNEKHNVWVKGYTSKHGGIESRSLTIDSYAGEKVTYTAHTAIGKGMSGGPVLLNKELVGVMQARDTDKCQSHIIPLLEFKSFLEQYIEVPTKKLDIIPDQDLSYPLDLFKIIDELFHPLFCDIINFYSVDKIVEEFGFLSFILQHQDNLNIDYIRFDDFLNSMVYEPSTTMIAQVRGDPGTGKSTLLSMANTYLRLCFQENKSGYVPIFIDANRYLSKQIIAHEGINQLRKDLDNIAKICESSKSQKIFLLFDGISISNHFSTDVLRESFIKFDSTNISGIIIAIEDKFDFEKLITEDVVCEGFKNGCIVKSFRLDTFYTERPDIDNFLQSFINCQNKLSGQSIQNNICLSHIKDKLDQFEIDEVDVHTLHLLHQSCGNKDYESCRTIGEFLKKYCENELASDNTSAVNNTFIKAANLAYQVFISSLPGNDRSRLSKFSPTEKTGKSWKLIHSHTNIRDFLTAHYIINTFADTYSTSNVQKKKYDDIIKEKILEIDFPNNVNRFVKNIINDNKTICDRVFNSIKSLLKKKDIPILTQNYLFYLLGRFESSGARKQAITLLLSYKKEHTSQEQMFLSNDKRILNKARLRTIFVSLAYLEHIPSVREYIDILLTDHEAASVNRGYHLIYYGDINEEINSPTRYLDVDRSSWNETFDSLTRHLRKHIQAKEDHRPAREIRILDIRLVSLASFAQSRMITGSLTELQKQRIIEVLNKLLEHNLIDNVKLAAYARSIAIDLTRPGYVNWAFILDIYRLKSTPRQGWLDRKAGEFNEMKHVESVADHTHLAFLLAFLLLPPETFHTDCPEYNKETIISMILSHDIAEAYTGDKVIRNLSPDKKEQHRILERQAMEYIMTRETYYNIPRIYDTIKLHDEWLKFDKASQEISYTTNEKIAKDIDRLENFIQLWIYKKRISVVEFDEFRENLLASFKTSLVMNLANSFDSWCMSDQCQEVLSKPLSCFQ